MKIKDIGGEFALIEQLDPIISVAHADLIVGVGDDAAVIRTAPEPAPYLLVTTDMLVEESHFRRDWATPEQIGIKAAQCNFSDIAAMGGTPTWMFISLALTEDTDVEWIRGVYRGISGACRQHGVVVAGGDTVSGGVTAISITLLGSVPVQDLCLRSHARIGDLLMVTGPLGASAAALHLLRTGKKPGAYLLEKHLTPTCRLDASGQIAALAHAMIDISDGLGSEVHHEAVIAAARDMDLDPRGFALSGGEDFELLFSIAPEKVADLKQTGLSCYPVGEIVPAPEGIVLAAPDGGRTPLPGGYAHFA
jgi:thiamine-monophosphate kinase